MHNSARLLPPSHNTALWLVWYGYSLLALRQRQAGTETMLGESLLCLFCTRYQCTVSIECNFSLDCLKMLWNVYLIILWSIIQSFLEVWKAVMRKLDGMKMEIFNDFLGAKVILWRYLKHDKNNHWIELVTNSCSKMPQHTETWAVKGLITTHLFCILRNYCMEGLKNTQPFHILIIYWMES